MPARRMVDEEMGMPAKRELSMRQLRTLLRLSRDGVSAREMGRRLGVARSTIQENLKRAAAAGLAWPLADDVTDEVLEQRLFGRAGGAGAEAARRDDDDPVGGISGNQSRGLRLQPVLRPAARLRASAEPGDAPTSRRRREGVC